MNLAHNDPGGAGVDDGVRTLRQAGVIPPSHDLAQDPWPR
jgi:hypothetical protein